MPSEVILLNHYGVLNEAILKDDFYIALLSHSLSCDLHELLNLRSLLNNRSANRAFPFEIMYLLDKNKLSFTLIKMRIVSIHLFLQKQGRDVTSMSNHAVISS